MKNSEEQQEKTLQKKTKLGNNFNNMFFAVNILSGENNFVITQVSI